MILNVRSIDAEHTKASKYFNIILAFVILANIFDMAGALGVKYFSYIFMIVYIVFRISKIRLRRDNIIIGIALFLLWPIFSLGWGVLNGGDIALGITQITAFFVMAVFFLFINLNEPMKAIRYIFNLLIVFGIAVITLFLLIYLEPEIFYLLKLNLLHENGTGYFGFRYLGSNLVPNIYFRATLFLVPAFIYFYFIKKKLGMVVCLVALICAFSKAALVAIIAFLALMPFTRKISIRSFIPLALVALIFLGVNYFVPAWGTEIVDTIKGETKTAQVRVNHYNSFKNLLYEEPLYFVIGQGVGTKFYSSASNTYVSNIEIDHINTVRKFGIVWFVLFGLVVLYICGQLIRSVNNELKGCGYGLLFSFIVTGTNPVLLSPLSLMLIAASYKALESEHVYK